MPDVKEKKAAKLRELFVQELAEVQGGKCKPPKPRDCPDFTTLSCGEEANGCSGG